MYNKANLNIKPGDKLNLKGVLTAARSDLEYKTPFIVLNEYQVISSDPNYVIKDNIFDIRDVILNRHELNSMPVKITGICTGYGFIRNGAKKYHVNSAFRSIDYPIFEIDIFANSYGQKYIEDFKTGDLIQVEGYVNVYNHVYQIYTYNIYNLTNQKQ